MTEGPTSTVGVPSPPDVERSSPPSVLIILVVKDGAEWVKRALASIRRQTHERVHVLAVDNASSDASPRILVEALGPDHVIRLDRNEGFPAAVARALATSVAHQADFVLLIHDDTILAPDAVALLVRTAGEEARVGVVGPKVLDTDRPEVLREVGMASDPFGYPYSPLEDDEIDQGQYDSPREVLFVSSTAMLVSREAWMRAGQFDERVGTCHGDLDFCWRVRLAGYRVLVNPHAIALHRAAGQRGERPGWSGARERYLAERAGLMSLLKNYRLFTLAWVLPLYAVQGIGKVVLFLLLRRFADAGQVAAAWGWNALNLPGTISRRVRGHAVRRARDRDIQRYMAPAGTRLRRWALQTTSVLLGERAGRLEPEETIEPPLTRRLAGFFGQHPVGLSLVAAVVLSGAAFREVLSATPLQGGSIPSFPSGAVDLFREFGSGWSSSGFGGTEGASPALVVLGLGSVLKLGNARAIASVIVAAGPLLVAASCYRAVLRMIRDRLASVIASACYALSALTMWAVSEGRVAVLIFLIALPWVLARIVEAFGRPIDRPGPWIVGTGMGLAVTASFFPAVWVAAAVAVISLVVLPEPGGNPIRGVALVTAAAGVAAILVFPFAITLIRGGGGAEVEAAGTAQFSALLRLSPGQSPGAWAPALFLPVGATLGLAVSDERRRAVRAAAAAGGCLLLAWMAAARRLPPSLANPLAYLGPVAFFLSLLVAHGVRARGQRIKQARFDSGAIVFGAMTAVIAGGLLLQTAQALRGAWAVGKDELPPAWAVIQSDASGDRFRVLWLGQPGGEAFVPPGGPPQGTVEVGAASVRYAVTGRAGASVNSIGRPTLGAAYEHLEEALGSVLSGRLRHGGAVFAPMGIRYVVTASGDLPREAARRLGQQLDLVVVQGAGGMTVYRNTASLPEAWALPGERAQAVTRSAGLTAAAALPREGLVSLDRESATAWTGSVALPEAGVVLAGTEYGRRWRLKWEPGSESLPFRAFGWGLGFDAAAGDSRILVSFEGQAARSIQVGALAALWAAALWSTRRRSDVIPRSSAATDKARR